MAKDITILVIGYWPLNDVLTQAAIIPHLRLLQEISAIKKIVLVTIERDDVKSPNTDIVDSLLNVKHVPLRSRNYKLKLLNKVNDFIVFPKQLLKLAMQEQVNVILASGTLAGALALKVWQRSKIPFYVLYEPHADYMVDSRVWQKNEIKYIFQKKWETEQLKAASGLLVVSQNYASYLAEQRLVALSKIKICRNPVNPESFKLNPASRSKIREQLGWAYSTIGIYTGKYGDLYYNNETFQIYSTCFKLIPDFRLIILSPQPKDEILQQLQDHAIDLTKVYVASVPHKDVPKYLSAADFAFATIKAFPSARYCSPVKIGEYWANGLPVLLTEGIGDDSDIIKNEGGGALFNLEQLGSVEKAIRQILTIVQEPTHRQEIPRLAEKYRSMEQVREAYEYFFKQQPEI